MAAAAPVGGGRPRPSSSSASQPTASYLTMTAAATTAAAMTSAEAEWQRRRRRRRRRSSASLLLPLAALLLAATAAPTTATPVVARAPLDHDCERGCPLAVDPVCGGDGRSYMNACVAACSSSSSAGNAPLPIASRGYCPGDNSVRFSASMITGSGAQEMQPKRGGQGALRIVPARVLYAYADEGFSYLGRVRLADPPAERRLFVASVAAAHADAAAARRGAKEADMPGDGEEAGVGGSARPPKEQDGPGDGGAGGAAAADGSSGSTPQPNGNSGTPPQQQVEIRRATSSGDVYSRTYTFVPGAGPFSLPPYNPASAGVSLARLFAAESSGPINSSRNGTATAPASPSSSSSRPLGASSPPPAASRPGQQPAPAPARPAAPSPSRPGAPPAPRPPTPNLRPEVGSVSARSNEGAAAAPEAEVVAQEAASLPPLPPPPPPPAFATFSSMLAELPVEEEEAEAEELAAAAAEASAAPRPQQQQPKQQLLHHQQHPLARGAAGVLDGLSVPLGALVVNPFKGFGGKARQGGAGAAAAVAATSVPAGARIAAPLPPQQQQQQPQADPLASAASAIKRWTAWKRGFVAGGGTGAGAAAAAAAAPATTTAAATSAAAATTTAAQPRAVAVPAAGGVWVGKKSGTAAGTAGRRRMLQLSLVEPPQQQQHGRSAPADAAAGDCAPPSSSTRSRSLRSIIGAVDSRRPCPVGQWPYTALGQITGLAVDGDFLCSGALVGRDRVLTAAHCVWDDRDARTFFRDLSFTPAQYKTPQGVVRAPVGKVAWEHVTILQAYADDPNFGGLAFDVAVIKLKEPIGDTLGWIGYRAACEGGGAPLSLTLAGYPGDSPKTRADDAFLGGCYADACGVLYDCRSGTNNHTCDSYVGQSGAPMWDRAYYARMVHTLGVLPGFSTTNAGVTLTPFLVEMIARFM